MSLGRTALTSVGGKVVGPVGYGLTEVSSLDLLSYYFAKYPEDADKVVLSIKGAFGATGPTGSPEATRAFVEEAVKVLDGPKTINVFEMARVDPDVPIETSVQALADLVKEGKIKGIGLSEVELSLFTPDPLHNCVADTCHELGIPIVAYSPIGRGQLSSEIRKLDELPPNDFRRMKPRFAPEVFDQNFKLVEAVEQLAERKRVTTAQMAISWVVCQGAIPIPGSTKIERVVQNSKVTLLTDEHMAELRGILDSMPVAGERYGGAYEALLNA